MMNDNIVIVHHVVTTCDITPCPRHPPHCCVVSHCLCCAGCGRQMWMEAGVIDGDNGMVVAMR
jgi:hypothetical protein